MILIRFLTICFLLAACGVPPSFTEPTDTERVPIVPVPAVAAAAADSLMHCSGRTVLVPFADVRFYLVHAPAIDPNPHDNIHVQGRQWVHTRNIYLERYAVQYPRVWMHELAHMLFAEPGHPADLFTRCGLLGLGEPDLSLSYLVGLL